MEKEKKTITVLVHTNAMRYGSLADMTTSGFKAYESYGDALIALKDEFTSLVNERILKHEKLIDVDIDDRGDIYNASIIYNDEHGNRHNDIFELHTIDLITR